MQKRKKTIEFLKKVLESLEQIDKEENKKDKNKKNENDIQRKD